MEAKIYFMYKTTNVKNNKFYIGVHETTNINDGYLGSGKKFKNSLYYHGRENFKREILEYFDSSEEMYNREREVVNEELLKDPKCLNIGIGGIGGFKSKEHQLKAAKASAKSTNKKMWIENREYHIKRISQQSKDRWKSNPTMRKKVTQNLIDYWTGRNHSEETKKKMSEAKKGKCNGSKNSQYGTCWITNGTVNKKIYKGDEIPEGFKLGRKIK